MDNVRDTEGCIFLVAPNSFGIIVLGLQLLAGVTGVKKKKNCEYMGRLLHFGGVQLLSRETVPPNPLRSPLCV